MDVRVAELLEWSGQDPSLLKDLSNAAMAFTIEHSTATAARQRSSDDGAANAAAAAATAALDKLSLAGAGPAERLGFMRLIAGFFAAFSAATRAWSDGNHRQQRVCTWHGKWMSGKPFRCCFAAALFFYAFYASIRELAWLRATGAP